MRPLRALLAASVAVILVAGCSSPKETPVTPSAPADAGKPMTSAKKGVIGVSVLTMGNPFFTTILDSMKAEAGKNGYEIIPTAAEMDAARQRDQVKDFIVKKVSAIVLCPADSRSVGTAIQEANKAGIPVFTADIACLDKSAKVVSHIATDNFEGGKLCGQAMLDALGGKGKVAIIDHPEVESVIQRTKGFREAVAGKPIDIVAQLPGGAQRDTAYKVAQDILQAHSDLDGIFCINDLTALGTIAAMEKAGRTNIKVVSFDGQPEAKQAIKQGKIYADSVQYPEKIGALTVQTIAKYMAGEKVPPQILIPTGLYKKADADKDPSVK